METCPKCGGTSIEWDGQQRQYICLWRSCGHTWDSFDGGSKPYGEIKNVFVKLSLAPGQALPIGYRRRGTNIGGY